VDPLLCCDNRITAENGLPVRVAFFQAHNMTTAQVDCRVDDEHELHLQKVLQKLQAGALALFRVELDAIDIVTLYYGGEVDAVIDLCYNVIRVGGDTVVAVDKVSGILRLDAFEQG